MFMLLLVYVYVSWAYEKEKQCDVFELRKGVAIGVEWKRRRILTVLIVTAAMKRV